MAIELGKTYQDRITRFTGVATGHVRYITGCNQVLLAPPVTADGKVNESHWFDEQRLAEQLVQPIVLDNHVGMSGFDKPAPRR